MASEFPKSDDIVILCLLFTQILGHDHHWELLYLNDVKLKFFI